MRRGMFIDYVPHNESVPDLKVRHLTILLSTDHKSNKASTETK